MSVHQNYGDILSSWNIDEDKAFENALAMYPEYYEDRWAKIAAKVPGKNMVEIKHHYDLLVDDVRRIESSIIPLPKYEPIGKDKGKGLGRKKEGRIGIPWSEHEHRLFLVGLENCVKGDWRSISRKYVVTRSPHQVASHAQKYFIRQNSVKKGRKRSSILDITNNGHS